MHTAADFDRNSRVQRKADVPWKQLDETVVILDLASGDFFELDEVAGHIWKALDGAATLAEIGQALATEYGIANDTALSDVMAFVGDLWDKGVVVRVG